jgi:hypothetical protein
LKREREENEKSKKQKHEVEGNKILTGGVGPPFSAD